jgi:hypothetical protein
MASAGACIANSMDGRRKENTEAGLAADPLLLHLGFRDRDPRGRAGSRPPHTRPAGAA